MPLPKPDTGEVEKDFIARCMGNETMQDDFKDNKQRLAVCYTQWRGTKEASMLSDENKKNLLQSGLIDYYGIKTESPKPEKISIEDVFDEHIVFDIDGQLYECSYEIVDGAPHYGSPTKVLITKVYKPMESLQETYSEIIQEVGKRNANLDSGRIKRIVALCQELLDSEPEEDEVKEALTEATVTLAWLYEQAAMKTEEGVKFPAAAFAYAPDPEKSSTWKLRLWEDEKVTKAQLGRAAAALSPGGFRGQKVQIPSEDLSAVKRKIRAEYRNLGIEDEDISRWVKETETREEVRNYIPLTEAPDDKGRATVIIIKAGFNASKEKYYPIEVLKRDYGIFEGVKMYADHPTSTEEKELPERSMRSSWVAVLKDVTCDENGVISGVAEIVEPWLMQKLATLREKGLLSEMGISINAVGTASKTTIDNIETLVIEKLERANSVDFVTEAGAQGIVTLYESDRLRNIDLIELETLKEKRPDLVKLIEAELKAEIIKEAKRMSEQDDKITELEGQNETLTTERDELKTKIEEAEKVRAKAEAQATIKEAVEQAEIHPAAKEQLIQRFKDAETADGIAEAIQTEKDYLAKLAESGKVKGLGETKVNPKDEKEAMKESFKRLGLPDDQAETAAIGR